MIVRLFHLSGLSKARDTPIGNEMIRGVSGGERKRTNIAVEMLSNPSLVFLGRLECARMLVVIYELEI